MGEHFARGRSAEIFRTEDGKILKLFFPDYPREYAEKEYKNTKIAASLGCTGMQVYDMVERGGRFGFGGRLIGYRLILFRSDLSYLLFKFTDGGVFKVGVLGYFCTFFFRKGR